MSGSIPGGVLLAAALAVSACGVPAPEAGDGAWQVDHIEADGGILSVWGSGPDDVWAAGGQVGRGLVLHDDGTGWRRVETGASELLRWIYGFHANDVYAVGEGGLILHYDGSSWQQVESGTDQTLYGVWGASGDDVWIVGGDATGAEGSAVVLRGQGRSFRVVDDVPAELLPAALYKIYGFHDRDVIAVGSGGTVLTFDGAGWRREEVPTEEALFSLWGRGRDDIYAVGGYGAGELLHFDGQRWERAIDAALPVPGLSGVFTAPDQPVIAVGADSYVIELEAGGVEIEPELPQLSFIPELHGVWGDGSGTTYAVGGDLYAYPDAMTGVIFRRH